MKPTPCHSRLWCAPCSTSAERVGPRAFEFVRRHWRTLQQYDQDSLNAVLAGRWKEIDPRWQVHPRTGNALGHPAPDDRYVVHFSGLLKPWYYLGREHADAVFFEFVDRTEWRGTRPRRTLRSWAMGLYDSPLRRLFRPVEKRLLARRNRLARQLRPGPSPSLD